MDFPYNDRKPRWVQLKSYHKESIKFEEPSILVYNVYGSRGKIANECAIFCSQPRNSSISINKQFI